jgi:hypothetical protein
VNFLRFSIGPQMHPQAVFPLAQDKVRILLGYRITKYFFSKLLKPELSVAVVW